MEAAHIAAVWVHILGIALFVGPQFFLAFAWVPVSRGIADQHMRVALTRKLTRRFGWIGGAGLVLIIGAGSYLISDWRDYYAQPDVKFTDLRYGVVFIIKMSLLIVMLAIVGLHTFLVGPRLVDAMEAQARNQPASDAAVRRARIMSMLFSISGLLLALAIMVLGVMLATPGYSQEVI